MTVDDLRRRFRRELEERNEEREPAVASYVRGAVDELVVDPVESFRLRQERRIQ